MAQPHRLAHSGRRSEQWGKKGMAAYHGRRAAIMGRWAAVLLLLLLPRGAAACGGASVEASPIIRASLASSDAAAVGITFLGHASFLIETPDHVSIVTDYNDQFRPNDPPDIATMNHAHSTHYSDHPDPRIKYVLHGWRDDGGPAHIDLTYRDVNVTNLPTNTRDYMTGGTLQYGNSVFIFASAGLCIAHLSHLHHELNAEDLAQLGHIDIVMAPIDGFLTLSHEEMSHVLDQLHASIVIPMHSFSPQNTDEFLALMQDRYRILRNPTPTVHLSRDDIQAHPEILVLPPQ
jgi:L-ascorbate metabolism protein UlaG (beta-lactamase superfamily)